MIQIKIDKKERAQIKAVLAFCDGLDAEGQEKLSQDIRHYLTSKSITEMGNHFGLKAPPKPGKTMKLPDVKALRIIQTDTMEPGEYLDKLDSEQAQADKIPVADKDQEFRTKVAELKQFHPFPTENEIEEIRRRVYA